MSIIEIPKSRRQEPHLASDYLAPILRGWNVCSPEEIASSICASPETVVSYAERMHLPKEAARPEKKSYAIHEMSEGDEERMNELSEFMQELLPFTGDADADAKIRDLHSRFAAAEDKIQRNALAAELRVVVEGALKQLEEIGRLEALLPDLGFSKSVARDSVRNYLRELALQYRYLLDKVYVKTVDKEDIVQALRELGVRQGGIVLVHSALSSFGNVIGGPQTVIDAFREVIGPDGTLVMPTLIQQDFVNAYRDWHIDRPSDVGILTEYFRKLEDAKRSDQATHSVAAQGPLADELTREHTAFGPRTCMFGDYAFGYSSPWQKMYDIDGQVVFLGVDLSANTFKHFIECRQVEERLEALKSEEEKEAFKARIWKHHQFNDILAGIAVGMWPFYPSVPVSAELPEGMVKRTTCGEATLQCMDIHSMVDETTKVLEADIDRWYSPDAAAWFHDADAAAGKGQA